MTVSAQETIFRHVGNGVTTVFAYECQVLQPNDLYAYADGIEVTSGITKTGIGSLTGGTVIFAVAPAAGVSIILERIVVLERTTDYQQNGDFLARVVNPDFNRIWMAIQQLASGVSRALRFPKTDVDPITELPPAADRADKLLSFDSLGNPVVVAPAAQSATALALAMAAPGGAALMGFQLNAIASIARLMSEKVSDFISSDDFAGMDKTGVAESSTAWDAALAATRLQGAPVNASRPLLIRTGTYKVSSGLTVGTNQRVIFESGVIIDASGLPNETTSVFNISNQTNVYFEGNGCLIKGARATANPAVEGNSCAFFLFGSDNIHIKNFRVQDFATDSITIDGDNTGSGPCTNVIVENCVSTNSRRNGMSIISVKGLVVIGGEYATANGGPGGPCAGIDIEPNDNCFLENVLLLNVRTRENTGSGIQLTSGGLSVAGAASVNFDVTIIGGGSVNDGAYGTNKAGLLFANGGTQLNRVYGQVNVRDFVVDRPYGRGVGFFNWDADKAPRVLLDNVTVYDPDYLLSGPTNLDRTGFVISCEAAHAITNLGNIVMRDCKAIDRRAVARMVWGTAINTEAAKQVKNVLIIDPVAVNYTATTKVDAHSIAANGPGSSDGFDIVYSTPVPVSISATSAITDYIGKRINVTASSVQTLPTAGTCKGAHYELQVEPGITNVRVAPAAGDTIMWYTSATTGIVLGTGAIIVLRSMGGTTWRVESIQGQAWQAGTSTPRHIYWHTAAPVSGTFELGDRFLNVAPAVGSPKGWICTASGTPGTWVSEGNL